MSSLPIRKHRVDRSAVDSVARHAVMQQMKWAIPFLALGALGGVVVINRSPGGVDPIVYAVFGGAIFVSLTAGVRLALQRGRHSWGTLELTVSENVLRIQTADLTPIEVLRPEVTRIVELKGGGLAVHTADPTRLILVSEHLEGFAELRAHLTTWRAFEPPSGVARIQIKAFAWSATLLMAWLVTGLAANIGVASVAGVIVLVMGSISAQGILASKTLSNRYKASAVISLGMFMMAPVARWVLYLWFRLPAGSSS